MYSTVIRVSKWSVCRREKLLPLILMASLGSSLMGCHDLTGSQPLPAGTQDPSSYNNATGALGMRNAALVTFINLLPDYLMTTGLLTDELTDLSTITNSTGAALTNGGAIVDPVDERILPEQAYGSTISYASDKTYQNLQTARAQILQALGQLATYDSSVKDRTVLPPALDSVYRGELYALYGYTEIMLADFFCSGVPLSTVDFQHDFTYKAGSTTQQVYQDAIAHLDTALALTKDSVQIQNLARIGLARAYLDLAYTKPTYVAAAADDVSGILSNYSYTVSSQFQTVSGSGGVQQLDLVGTVADREGANGLPYLSSGDPRTADTTLQYTNNLGHVTFVEAVGFPQKYEAAVPGLYTPVTVASGVEATLIEAEAALQPGGAGVTAWLGDLNSLRENAPALGTMPPLSVPLPDLTDPGIGSGNPDSARLALTFQERAYWLYMTGHREGDLRRQMRQYSYWKNESLLYPAGTYLGLGSGAYGGDVTAPIPANEFLNPFFRGCLNRAP